MTETPRTFAPPNRIPWPPIIFGLAATAAFALGIAFPSPEWLRHPMLSGLGWGLVFMGLGLDFAAMFTMQRRRANILPHRAATALVTSGPFALSRNPIYLGNTIAMIGVGFAFANLWFITTAFLAAWAVVPLAIHREEAHLAEKFGEAWQAYRRQTNRWFGRKR